MQSLFTSIKKKQKKNAFTFIQEKKRKKKIKYLNFFSLLLSAYFISILMFYEFI